VASPGQGAASPFDEFPILTEWVTAAEAAEIGGVSRQYIHNRAHQFTSAHRLGTRPAPTDDDPDAREGGMLVLLRAEVEEWAAGRRSGLVDDEG
jgi:hypothetical protein